MPAIDTPELKTMQETNVDFLLVNTLPEPSFEKTKLPGAVNIPQDQDDFVDQVEKAAGGKDKKIVVYCANLECDSSTSAAKKLDHAGFTNVFDYRRGAQGWQQDMANEAAHTAG